MAERRSYRKLSALPSFGLYTGNPQAVKPGDLIATVRAEDTYKAREIFKAHGLVGEWVGRTRGS